MMPVKSWTHNELREYWKRRREPDSAILDRLAACVGELPLDSDVATERTIRRAALLLYESGFNDDMPSTRNAGTDDALDALYEVMNLAKELHERLINLPNETWNPLLNNLGERGLMDKFIWLLGNDEALMELSDAAAFASRDLWAEPHTPAVRRRGRPRKLRAHAVATCAARQFLSMTRRKPTVIVDRIAGTAGGPFMRFLAEVFEVLEIDASPEACARQAVMEKKRV